MGKCEICGKETRDGQQYCDECLENMNSQEVNTLGMNDNEFVIDDLDQILADIQSDQVENDRKQTASDSPSSMSDIFSDAVSAISSLEDDEIEEDQAQELEQSESNSKDKKKKKKKKRRFRKNKSDEKENQEHTEDIASLDDLAIKEQTEKQLTKEKAEQEKEELKNKLEQEKKDKQAEAEKKKAEKAKAKAEKAKQKADKAKEKKEKAEAKKKAKAEKKEAALKAKESETIDSTLDDDEDDGYINKPLTIGIFVTFIIMALVIIIGTNIFNYDLSISTANRKFNHKKYRQAYEEIYGLEIKKDDEKLYDKIMTVMYVNKQLESYNNYMGLEMYPEALDSLIKGLKRYEKYIEHAENLGIKSDLDYVRKHMLTELKRKFNLSEKRAMKLVSMKDQTKYSIKIYDIVLENIADFQKD